MRRRVYAELAVEPGARPARDAEPPALLQLGIRELLLYGLIENRGAVVVAAAFGFAWELGLLDRAIGGAFGDRLSGRGLIRDLVRGVAGAGAVTPDRIALALAALVALLVLVRVLSMGWALVRLFGFRVRLVEADLRSEYGLFTRMAATIPSGRIQTLTIHEGPLHRLFHRAAVRANTAGGHTDPGGRAEREWLAPLIGRDALAGFVRTVLDGIDLGSVSWNRVAPGAFRREVKRWLVGAGLLLGGAFSVGRWWALVLVPLLGVWALVGARETVRRLGWAVTGEAVLFRRGWLHRRVSIVRLGKIQVVALGESPFDRRTDMARLLVDTAGGSASSRVLIPYLPRETACALKARLSEEAAARPFKW
jgi:putative membrane protein